MTAMFAPSFDLHLVLACIASCAVLAAAVTDLVAITIPNRLTLPLLVLAPLVHGFAAGPGALGLSLLAAALCGLVPALAFARGGLGGGDVKLFAALGALLGCELGLRIELGALCLAALYASFVLVHRGQLFRTLISGVRLFSKELPSAAIAQSETCMRLGPAIAAATLLTLWLGDVVP